jgi:hypothetical protein
MSHNFAWLIDFWNSRSFFLGVGSLETEGKTVRGGRSRETICMRRMACMERKD